MRWISTLWARAVAVTTAAVVTSTILVAAPASAITLNGADFKPGNIISDTAFYDSSGLTEAQIQAFLDKKIGTCLSSSDLCLNVYTQTTTSRPQTYINGASDLANPLCRPYAGEANEPASRIIYKVQVACGISAKAILVTLHKENGLITKTNPSASSLRTAMGMGCPDTAACDSYYFGFFNQVYYGASQLKRYSSPASYHYLAYAPPYRTSNIYYHPPADDGSYPCGSKSVYVENVATHALYRYTPYTPNAAALANLYGTGDSCSAYGNSNFWEYYTTWFDGKANLLDHKESLPELTSSELGAAVSSSSCTVTADWCYIQYEHGVTQWNYLGVIRKVVGAIGDAYLAEGGPTGWMGVPVGNLIALDGGANGVGERQQMRNGQIVRTPDNVTYALPNDVYDSWMTQGGPSGALGWPSTVGRCEDAVCEQEFTGGYVMSTTTGTLMTLTGRIASTVKTMGGIDGAWGLPVLEPVAVNAGTFGEGRRQRFAAGMVYESANSVQMVPIEISRALSALGGPAKAGWPILQHEVSTAGDMSQRFTSGTLVRTAANANWLVKGAIGSRYASVRGVKSYLGNPRSAEIVVSGARGTTGVRQQFVGGFIIQGPTGAFAMPNKMWLAYRAKNYYRGSLGWPIANASLRDGVWTQRFQGGTVTTPAG
ncbi:hypothetical protein C8A06_1008 [Microbacteriaceae bacterium MWH-Ta3]|nr:hypothetical protein C8A06_1008 [Microbacteriaceae bacterium MWH-Ta3]